jgi:hypothetical protein
LERILADLIPAIDFILLVLAFSDLEEKNQGTFNITGRVCGY